MELKPAQVVVSTGGKSLVGRILRFGADSRWTHVFIVLDEDEAVESYFPHGVRVFSWRERLAEIEREGRVYAVIDRLHTADADRQRVVDLARTLVGRRYDWVQAVLYALTNKFWGDGPRRLICSRLVTSVFYDVNLSLFPKWWVIKHPGPRYRRFKQLLKGWVTPKELLYYGFVERVLPPPPPTPTP